MNSLSEFLSLPLLHFILSNLPSNNTEQPDKLDILLQTLPEGDIQLLDSRVTDDLIEIQRSNGTQYKPECLQVMLSVMDWYLRELG